MGDVPLPLTLNKFSSLNCSLFVSAPIFADDDTDLFFESAIGSMLDLN